MPRPSDKETRSLMARALADLQSNNPERAAAGFRKIIRDWPAITDARHFLGIALHQQGKSEEALQFLLAALKASPDNPGYHSNIGIVLRSMGRQREAAEHFLAATRIAPNHAEAWFNLGLSHQEEYRLPDAIHAYRTALALRPEHSKTLVNLAGVLRTYGNLREAVDACERALTLNPLLVEAHQVLASCLIESGDFRRAVERLNAGLSLLPHNIPLSISLAEVEAAAGHSDVCMRICEDVLQMNPDPAACGRIGEIYRSVGDAAAADIAFCRALAKDPDNAVSLFGRIYSKRMTVEDRHLIDQSERLLARELPEDDRIRLCFGLGKAFDDLGEFEQAFRHYEAGNRICHRRVTFDSEGYRQYVSRIVDAFPAAFLDERQERRWHDSDVPIFIIGMPRSGTTLVEQILASHPAVASAGELLHVIRIAQSLGERLKTTNPYPENIAEIGDREGELLASEYLSGLPQLQSGQQHVTDKMPNNFVHAGLIASLFPRSRIIHCRRQPLDVCLSVYFQMFDRSHSYAFDLGDIGFYYREYERLMAHWRRLLGNRLIEIDYDRIVEDQRGETARLLEFCDLPWSDTCLRFHETRRTVFTASRWQVRQPIYRRSLERWRNYRSFLAPLFEALGEYAPPLGDVNDVGGS